MMWCIGLETCQHAGAGPCHHLARKRKGLVPGIFNEAVRPRPGCDGTIILAGLP